MTSHAGRAGARVQGELQATERKLGAAMANFKDNELLDGLHDKVEGASRIVEAATKSRRYATRFCVSSRNRDRP